MSYLTSIEAAEAVTDVLAMLASTGIEVYIHVRELPEASGGFAGKGPGSFNRSNATPALVTDKQPSDLLQVDHDLMVSLPPATSVTDDDRIELNGVMYTVVDIQRINLFGTTTHLEVAVKKERGV